MTGSSRIVHRSLCGFAVATALLMVGCGQSPTSSSDTDATFLILKSAAGDWVGGGISRHYTVENSTIRAVVGQEFSYLEVNITPRDRSEWWTLRVRAPQGKPLLPGVYQPINGWIGARPPTEAQLDFSGTGRSCLAHTGRLVVRSLKYGSLGEIERFHATFEQTCNGSSAGLTGEVHIVDGGVR